MIGQTTNNGSSDNNGSSEAGNWITVAKACALAGVSADTMQQYVTVGLLAMREEKGVREVSERDVRMLFSVGDREPEKTALASEKPTEANSTAENLVTDSSLSSHISPSTVVGEAVTLSKSDQETPGATTSDKTSDNHEQAAAKTYDANSYSRLKFDGDANYESSGPDVGSLVQVSRELRAQIQILKDERDWLRTRVEKLESRGERDQLLLLAETQAVKALLDAPRPSGSSRRGWRRILAPFSS